MTTQSAADSWTVQSRDLTLALLAARLAEVCEQVGGIAARLAGAEATIREQADLLAESVGLAREVSRLSAVIAAQDSSAADRHVTSHPRMPVWAAMNRTEYLGALSGLASWVTGLLLQRYPVTATVLQPCWPAHAAVVEELDWLHWDWTGWALEPGARSRDAADWHDRWLPGVLARVRPQLAICGQQGRHAELANRRQVPTSLNVAGRAPEEVFIEQMASASRGDRRDTTRPR